MTDLNALIERLESLGRKKEFYEYERSIANEAATYLRTLAERQPVGDALCARCSGIVAPVSWDNLLQAAEQRGADRAFEEAAVIAAEWMQNSALAGDCNTQEAQETGKRIAATIRQRIGEK